MLHCRCGYRWCRHCSISYDHTYCRTTPKKRLYNQIRNVLYVLAVITTLYHICNLLSYFGVIQFFGNIIYWTYKVISDNVAIILCDTYVFMSYYISSYIMLVIKWMYLILWQFCVCQVLPSIVEMFCLILYWIGYINTSIILLIFELCWQAISLFFFLVWWTVSSVLRIVAMLGYFLN